MKIEFYKYQGTGNDFVLMDNRDGHLNELTTKHVRHICDRHFGVGADGLMLLNKKEGYHFNDSMKLIEVTRRSKWRVR